MSRRISTICGASLASICLVPALILGQTKRSKSDADINAVGGRNITEGPNFYSPEKEKQLGSKLALEVVRSSQFVNDPSITASVERIAQTVERNSDKHMRLTIKLMDTEDPKAFTLLGGYQYITRGLFLRLKDEGELASVLARGLALSIPLLELKAKRDSELDADYFGLQYVYKSGYDPRCFVDLLKEIGDTNKNVPEKFSEYPPLPQRLQALQNEIADILPQRDGSVTSTQEFEEFKKHLQAVKSQTAAPPRLRIVAKAASISLLTAIFPSGSPVPACSARCAC
jgi:predicted Zn-dependent protease